MICKKIGKNIHQKLCRYGGATIINTGGDSRFVDSYYRSVERLCHFNECYCHGHSMTTLS